MTTSSALLVIIVDVDVTHEINKAGYTAQDAPGMRSFHLRKKTRDGPTDGPTDGHDLI